MFKLSKFLEVKVKNQNFKDRRTIPELFQILYEAINFKGEGIANRGFNLIDQCNKEIEIDKLMKNNIEQQSVDIKEMFNKVYLETSRCKK